MIKSIPQSLLRLPVGLFNLKGNAMCSLTCFCLVIVFRLMIGKQTFLNIRFSARLPSRAMANVIGNINNNEFGIATLIANITKGGQGSRVYANLHNIPESIR